MKLTNEEAIETIKILKGLVAHGMSDQSKIVAAWDMAIEALEMRNPVRPARDWTDGTYICPYCSVMLEPGLYCRYCGKAILHEL